MTKSRLMGSKFSHVSNEMSVPKLCDRLQIHNDKMYIMYTSLSCIIFTTTKMSTLVCVPLLTFILILLYKFLH